MAHTCPPLEQVADDPDTVTAWVARLPAAEKNQLHAMAESFFAALKNERVHRTV